MLAVGLAMLGTVAAMLVAARPRDEKVVDWLQTELRQQLYGFALILLLSIGSFLSLSGLGR
jgi:hypothetical protein